jgi:hypothetical protein
MYGIFLGKTDKFEPSITHFLIFELTRANLISLNSIPEKWASELNKHINGELYLMGYAYYVLENQQNSLIASTHRFYPRYSIGRKETSGIAIPIEAIMVENLITQGVTHILNSGTNPISGPKRMAQLKRMELESSLEDPVSAEFYLSKLYRAMENLSQ